MPAPSSFWHIFDFLLKPTTLSDNLLEGSFSRPDSPGYRPHYILDLTNGQRYELLELDWLPRLDGFKFDPQYYAYFQTAENIFIHHSKNVLIALSSDFRQHPERNVVFSQFTLSQSTNSGKGELLEQLMKDLGKDYEVIDLSTTRSADVSSPTGKYVARNDGIYLSATNTRVVTRQYMSDYLKGWYYDESGVVVQEGATLLDFSYFGHAQYVFNHPILKLRLPTP